MIHFSSEARQKGIHGVSHEVVTAQAFFNGRDAETLELAGAHAHDDAARLLENRGGLWNGDIVLQRHGFGRSEFHPGYK